MRFPIKLRRPRHTVFEDDVGDDDDEAAHPAVDYVRPPGLRLIGTLTFGGVLLAVFFGGYAALWFGMAWSFRTSALEWAASERAAGRGVDYGETVAGGFPFQLRLTVPSPVYVNGQYAISAERAVLSAKLWSPGHIRAVLTGPFQVTVPDGKTVKIFSGTARLLEGAFAFSDDRPTLLAADIGGLSFADGSGGASFGLESGFFRFQKADEDDTAYTVHLRLGGLSATGLDGLAPLFPLGSRVAAVHFNSALKGQLPTGKPVVDALGGWRDAGGTLDVSRFQISYGPLDVRSSGTVSLDENLQPIAAFTAQAEGFFAFIDALWRRGTVRGRDAVTAKAVLGAMIKKPEAGMRPSINLAITVQNRVLYAGPVPLWRFPTVVWPVAPVQPDPAMPAGKGKAETEKKIGG